MNLDFMNAIVIIQKHISVDKPDIINCQEELIDNNLKDFAEL